MINPWGPGTDWIQKQHRVTPGWQHSPSGALSRFLHEQLQRAEANSHGLFSRSTSLLFHTTALSCALGKPPRQPSPRAVTSGRPGWLSWAGDCNSLSSVTFPAPHSLTECGGKDSISKESLFSWDTVVGNMFFSRSSLCPPKLSNPTILTEKEV